MRFNDLSPPRASYWQILYFKRVTRWVSPQIPLIIGLIRKILSINDLRYVTSQNKALNGAFKSSMGESMANVHLRNLSVSSQNI